MKPEKLKELIKDLCESADLPTDPENVSGFLFARSMGEDRVTQSKRANRGVRTLQIWEDKMGSNLSIREEILLVEVSVEYQRRKFDSLGGGVESGE